MAFHTAAREIPSRRASSCPDKLWPRFSSSKASSFSFVLSIPFPPFCFQYTSLQFIVNYIFNLGLHQTQKKPSPIKDRGEPFLKLFFPIDPPGNQIGTPQQKQQ